MRRVLRFRRKTGSVLLHDASLIKMKHFISESYQLLLGFLFLPMTKAGCFQPAFTIYTFYSQVFQTSGQ